MAIAEPEVTDAVTAPEPNGSAPDADGRGLILDSLEIKNFRAFRHLVVPKQGRVNLITGKNGVGKSSLLEALYLYAHSASPQAVRQVLLDRREVLVGGLNVGGHPVEAPVSVQTLFNEISNGSSQHFFVGAVKDDAPNFMTTALHVELISDPDYGGPDGKIEVHGAFGNEHYYGAAAVKDGRSRAGQLIAAAHSDIPCAFLPSGVPNGNFLAAQWDSIALTVSEDIILQALRLLNPKIQRIAFVSETQSPLGRVGMVKTSDFERPVSMARLGNGLMRAFACALSLTGSTAGIFLVDEIENGLHYSILPDVWRLIFQTARRLNLQVFATTHSWDCIEAFQQAAAEDEEGQAMLIRLQSKSGNVVSTVFDERRLAIITRDGIEVR